MEVKFWFIKYNDAICRIPQDEIKQNVDHLAFTRAQACYWEGLALEIIEELLVFRIWVTQRLRCEKLDKGLFKWFKRIWKVFGVELNGCVSGPCLPDQLFYFLRDFILTTPNLTKNRMQSVLKSISQTK